jgi:hypothetical protein
MDSMKMGLLLIRCRRELYDSTMTRAQNEASAIIGQQPLLLTYYIRQYGTFCGDAHFTGTRSLV